MEEYLNEIRENLFNAMNRKNWNHTELAIQCGISTRQMSGILNRESSDIKLSTIIRISEGIGKAPAFLIAPGELKKTKDEELLRKIHGDLLTYMRYAGIPSNLLIK